MDRLANATLFFLTLFSSCFQGLAGLLAALVRQSSAFFLKTLQKRS
jgi:hypothetical protein